MLLLHQDADVLELLNTRLSRRDVVENGFILDGFPRTVAQAQALKESSLAAPLQLVIVRTSNHERFRQQSKAVNRFVRPPFCASPVD